MRVLSVVGARPQFVKLAPMAEAFAASGVEHVIVHTGQHYDPVMSGVFFEDLSIPEPMVNLAVGSGGHGEMTGQMLAGLEPILSEQQPDWVLAYGDTNSTLAAALAAVKLHIPLAHLEAGLRSFNRRMPEEHNRVLTDHAADLLLAPTEIARANLISEGLAHRTEVVGDVMTDICLRVLQSSGEIDLNDFVPAEPYVLATIHRAENTDDKARLTRILDGLRSQPVPVVLAAHPRIVAKATSLGLDLSGGSLKAIDPLPYPQMVAAVARAQAVVTDSGGLQKEAYLIGTPCTTLRSETEWIETINEGWNRLDTEISHPESWTGQPPNAGDNARHAYGAGDSARRVVEALHAHQPA